MSKKKEDNNITESGGWVNIESTQNHSKGSPGVINVQDEYHTDTEGGGSSKDNIEHKSEELILVDSNLVENKLASPDKVLKHDEPNDKLPETILCGQCCCTSDCVIF